MALTPVPITDEQAKAIQATARFGSGAVDLIKSVGGYFGSAFGPVQ